MIESLVSAATNITSGDVESLGGDSYFIGVSPMMRGLRQRVAQLANCSVHVFIQGESGSGRETIGRLLHKLSVRSGFGFDQVNCAVLPEELLEREIFGYAEVDTKEVSGVKRGKLEFCDKGTIFIDQITEMSLPLQKKLARVLETRQFVRNETTVCVDVRVVAASSLLGGRVNSEQQILPELACQFIDHKIQVPPLRERKDELPALSCHLMHRLAERYGLPSREIPQMVNEAWQAHEWPGNFRELEQFVKCYLVDGDRGEWLPKQLSDPLENPTAQTPPECQESNQQEPILQQVGNGGYKSLRALLRSVKEEAEKTAIILALQQTGWNRKAAARCLKVSYRTVLYKIEQYKLSPSDTHSTPASRDAVSKRNRIRVDLTQR